MRPSHFLLAFAPSALADTITTTATLTVTQLATTTVALTTVTPTWPPMCQYAYTYANHTCFTPPDGNSYVPCVALIDDYMTKTHFNISGSWDSWNLDNLNKDNGGKGLLDNLRGCGIIYDWWYKELPESHAYDFEATGWLPFIYKGSCPFDAMMSAGAPKGCPYVTQRVSDD